jgi:dynactin complex subunit
MAGARHKLKSDMSAAEAKNLKRSEEEKEEERRRFVAPRSDATLSHLVKMLMS